MTDKTLLTLLPALLTLLIVSTPARGADEALPTGDSTPASAATASPAATTTPTRFSAGMDSRAEQLTQALTADTRTLTLESDTEHFNVLLQLPAQPEPLGGLMILPDPDSGDAWADQVQALHFGLARHGWITLALEPPQPTPPSLPKRTLPVRTQLKPNMEAPPAASSAALAAPDSASAANDAEPNADQPGFAEQFSERLELAREELENVRPATETPISVLLAIGRAAPWAMQYAIGNPEPPLHLVLIDPRPDSTPDAPTLDVLWEQLGEQRIIDLYHWPLPGYPDAAPDARIRREQAQRLGLTHYYQARLAGNFSGWDTQMPWLVRSVRGVLDKQLVEPIQAAALAKKQPPQGATSQKPPGSN